MFLKSNRNSGTEWPEKQLPVLLRFRTFLWSNSTQSHWSEGPSLGFLFKSQQQAFLNFLCSKDQWCYLETKASSSLNFSSPHLIIIVFVVILAKHTDIPPLDSQVFQNIFISLIEAFNHQQMHTQCLNRQKQNRWRFKSSIYQISSRRSGREKCNPFSLKTPLTQPISIAFTWEKEKSYTEQTVQFV